MVEYFDVPDVPGQYFACTRYGTMSVGSCAKNFDTAPSAVRSGRLDACIGCPIGAQHAAGDAKPAVPVTSTTPLSYRVACLRCRRSGRNSGSRLMGRMRLVRGHTICVSCYNREREVLHGANAKGAKPKKWSGLFTPDAAYVKGNTVVRDKLPGPVMDRVEAVLTVIRLSHTKSVIWSSPTIGRLALGV